MKPKPGQPLGWSLECQATFEKLKCLFTVEPILKHPNPEKPFAIQADASVLALVGKVLLQKNGKGEVQPCTYTSHKLSETKRHWAIWEKKAYTV